MKCNLKMMVSIALTLAVAIAIAYWAVPQLRGAFSTLAVIASAFVCPLAMMFMMRGMQSHAGSDVTAPRATDKTTPERR